MKIDLELSNVRKLKKDIDNKKNELNRLENSLNDKENFVQNLKKDLDNQEDHLKSQTRFAARAKRHKKNGIELIPLKNKKVFK